MNLEIGISVKIMSLNLAMEVFEYIPKRDALEYCKRRKRSVRQTGTLSGSLNEKAGVYYVQMGDGLMTPFHQDELKAI